MERVQAKTESSLGGGEAALTQVSDDRGPARGGRLGPAIDVANALDDFADVREGGAAAVSREALAGAQLAGLVWRRVGVQIGVGGGVVWGKRRRGVVHEGGGRGSTLDGDDGRGQGGVLGVGGLAMVVGVVVGGAMHGPKVVGRSETVVLVAASSCMRSGLVRWLVGRTRAVVRGPRGSWASKKGDRNATRYVVEWGPVVALWLGVPLVGTAQHSTGAACEAAANWRNDERVEQKLRCTRRNDNDEQRAEMSYVADGAGRRVQARVRPEKSGEERRGEERRGEEKRRRGRRLRRGDAESSERVPASG
ncbi:hypothetical protein IWX91DRAFT_340960 [Phyllosticta citricarpa]